MAQPSPFPINPTTDPAVALPIPPADGALRLTLTRTFSFGISAAEMLANLSDEEIWSECVRRDVARAEAHVARADALLTPAQIRGARGLLDWTLNDLAKWSGISVSTIKRIEDGSELHSRSRSHAGIRGAFEAAGVRFVVMCGDHGIVLASPVILQQAAE